MARPSEVEKGGGFLSRLFSCRPQHPADTGVVVNEQTRDKLSNGSAHRGGTTAIREPSANVKSTEDGKVLKTMTSTERKAAKNGTTPRDLPAMLTPPPPSDEVTPITSNRKSPHGNKSMLSNSTSAADRLEQVLSGGSTYGREGLPPVDFIDELESSIQQAATETSENSLASDRKAYPTFHNTRPMQENIKAKQQLFEGTYTSANNPVDATESTADVTETSIGGMDDLNVQQIPSSNEKIVDCENDPWEGAYAVWYRKGLLKWRPKSVDVAPSVSATEDEVDISGSSSLDLVIVDPAESVTNPAQSANGEDVSTNEETDETALLRKFRSKPADKVCANCGKDTSLTLELVRCVQCKQDLYCSLFCRGNHRYKHAPDCTPLQSQQKHSRPAPSPLVKSPPSTGNGPTLSKESNLSAMAFEEEKKEDIVGQLVDNVSKSVGCHGEEGSTISSDLANVSGSVPAHMTSSSKLVKLDQTQGRFVDSTPAMNNTTSATLLVPFIEKETVYLPEETTGSSLTQSTDASLHILPSTMTDDDNVATPVKTQPTFNPSNFSSVEMAMSRSSSLQKSKQAPMVSMFGSTMNHLSPRRLLTESE
jgi:MYND finger